MITPDFKRYDCLQIGRLRHPPKGTKIQNILPRHKIVVCVIVATSLVTVAAQTYLVDQDETVARADSLFGQRYNSKYEEGRGWGYPEGPIYWFNAAYVVRLLFAKDGSLARLELKPEAFLHGQMSATGVKLGASDVQWFLKAAKQLRPLGDPVDVHKPPLCFQSSSNSYCSDRYAQAKVDQYLRGSLKSVTIAYKQSRHGTVSDRQAFPFNRIKVGQRWYAIDQKLFKDAVIGSTVNLTTFGCGVESIDCEAIGNKANPQK